MAKCVGWNIDWASCLAAAAPVVDPITSEPCEPYSKENTAEGERSLRTKLDQLADTISSIGVEYVLIRNSVRSDGSKINCNEVQDLLVTQLKQVYQQVVSVADSIATAATLEHRTKQRYFLYYTCEIVDKLQGLLIMVGRLSELDQPIFDEDHRKSLICEESTTIHALATIWAGAIKIMGSIQPSHRKMIEIRKQKELAEQAAAAQVQSNVGDAYDDDEDEDTDYIKEMDFYTAHIRYAEVFMMDLVITSWLQFNRLVRYDDLLKGCPFLCQCQCKAFFRVMDLVDAKLLDDLMHLVMDYQSKPSYETISVRQYGPLPIDPIYRLSDRRDLAYFVVWHFCGLLRFAKTDKHVEAITRCSDTFEKALREALQLFPHDPTSGQTLDFLSPHQEERLKLLIVLVHRWCEKDTKRKEAIMKHIQLVCPKQPSQQQQQPAANQQQVNLRRVTCPSSSPT